MWRACSILIYIWCSSNDIYWQMMVDKYVSISKDETGALKVQRETHIQEVNNEAKYNVLNRKFNLSKKKNCQCKLAFCRRKYKKSCFALAFFLLKQKDLNCQGWVDMTGESIFFFLEKTAFDLLVFCSLQRHSVLIILVKLLLE